MRAASFRFEDHVSMRADSRSAFVESGSSPIGTAGALGTGLPWASATPGASKRPRHAPRTRPAANPMHVLVENRNRMTRWHPVGRRRCVALRTIWVTRARVPARGTGGARRARRPWGRRGSAGAAGVLRPGGLGSTGSPRRDGKGATSGSGRSARVPGIARAARGTTGCRRFRHSRRGSAAVRAARQPARGLPGSRPEERQGGALGDAGAGEPLVSANERRGSRRDPRRLGTSPLRTTR